MVTFGTVAEGVEYVGRVVVFTLGDASTGASWFIGISSTLLSFVASVNNAFLTGSPAARLGVVVGRVRVSIRMMSPAACFRWLLNLTSGNGADVVKM